MYVLRQTSCAICDKINFTVVFANIYETFECIETNGFVLHLIKVIIEINK